MADDPHPLALFKRPVPLDDNERLWLSANYHDWAAVVLEHELSVVIDLEQDLDRGIHDHNLGTRESLNNPQSLV